MLIGRQVMTLQASSTGLINSICLRQRGWPAGRLTAAAAGQRRRVENKHFTHTRYNAQVWEAAGCCVHKQCS